MTTESTQSSTLSPAAVELLWRGDVVGAIKTVRAERNLGLKEAKDLVDAYILSSQPALRQKMEQAQAEMLQKLKRGLIVALLFAAAAAYFLFLGR
jgi:ribosomal protein L7/L12